MPTRCYWCGRYGASPTTYQLHHTTATFTRNLCPSCAASALESTLRTRAYVDNSQHID